MTKSEDFERWVTAAAWSTGPELTSMQTLLWRSESHPVQSSTSTVVIDLDRAPDWDRFVAATEWGTRLVRRLRQRVVEPVVPTAAPTWADDPTFDLGYHLRRERIASREEMLVHAAQLALHPFDRTRPLWEGVLFEGMADGAAYVLKIHHALADPLGTVQLLSMLQSGKRAHTARKPAGEEVVAPAAAEPGHRAELLEGCIEGEERPHAPGARGQLGRGRRRLGEQPAHRRAVAQRRGGDDLRSRGGEPHATAGRHRLGAALRRVGAPAAHPGGAALARADPAHRAHRG